MTTNNKTLLASGSVLALSIMMVAGLSFASAYGPQTMDGFQKGGVHAPEDRLALKAEFFNMTPEELKERIDSGETFRDVAESLGITKEDMKAHMKERASEHIEQLLADGEITQDRADEMLQRIEDGEFRGKGKRMFRKGFHKGYGEGYERGFGSKQSI